MALRSIVPLVIAVAAVVALVLAINPRQFAHAAEGFDVRTVPAVVALSLGYYLLQGVRWHFLLRTIGVRLRLRDTVVLNLAGQSTGLLPFGELTRAVLVAEAADAEFGGVVATITVQELIYTLVIIAAAVPGAVRFGAALGGVAAALVGAVTVFVILCVPAVFRRVLAVVRRTPVLRGHVASIEALQRDTVIMMRRPDTASWSVLSVLGALDAITLFWLVVQSIHPGLIAWHDAAFVYAVSHVLGAITFSPGGLGSFEASTVGLLVASGADAGTAVAAALLMRGADKGLASLVGMGAYVYARRRYRFSRLRLGEPVTPRQVTAARS